LNRRSELFLQCCLPSLWRAWLYLAARGPMQHRCVVTARFSVILCPSTTGHAHKGRPSTRGEEGESVNTSAEWGGRVLSYVDAIC